MQLLLVANFQVAKTAEKDLNDLPPKQFKQWDTVGIAHPTSSYFLFIEPQIVVGTKALPMRVNLSCNP